MNYYNEFDPYAAAWLRGLIEDGLIPDGVVDDRSIVEVHPEDLKSYAQCHFFAGVVGWAEALRLAGWPEDRPVWTGSCPCQPYSAAGKRKGDADERNLWPEFFRLIRGCRPSWVFGEQVEAAIAHGWLDNVCADLEGEGYACRAAVLGAHSVGAPHRRQRLYWLADTERTERRQNPSGRDDWQHRAELKRQASGGSWDGGQISQLADANGGHPGPEREQRGWQHGQQPEYGGTDRLEHSPSDGRQQWGAEPSERCAVGGCGAGLGNADDEGSQGRIERGDCAGQRAPWEASVGIICADGKTRLVPAQSELFGLVDGLYRRLADLRPEDREAAAKACLWPLAQKVKGRVGMLRGFGNAICIPTAAAFILSCS